MILNIQAFVTYRLIEKGRRSESIYRLREPVPVDVLSVSSDAAPIICRSQDGDEAVVLRAHGGRILTAAAPIDEIVSHPANHGLQATRIRGDHGTIDKLEIRRIVASDKEHVSAEIQKNAQDFLFVDGNLYRTINEPVILRRRLIDHDQETFEFKLDCGAHYETLRRETVAEIHIYGVAEFEAARPRICGPSDTAPTIDLVDPSFFRHDGRAHALRHWARLTLDEAADFLGKGTREFAECFFALRDLVEAEENHPGSVPGEELIPCLEAIAEVPGRDGKPILGGRGGNLALVRHYQDVGLPIASPHISENRVADLGSDHRAPMI